MQGEAQEQLVEQPVAGRSVEALWTGAKAGALLVALYMSLFHVSIVRGGSMSPGIHDGDRILVDQLGPLLGSVARGDIVVLRCPLDPRYDYIKRVVALPGETVEVRHGRVWIDGFELDEPYVERQDPRSALRMVVPDDSYFVMGDNRRHSSDSREFGVVAGEQLVGVVGVRLWPLERAGVLP
jgi:signal peptidase I